MLRWTRIYSSSSCSSTFSTFLIQRSLSRLSHSEQCDYPADEEKEAASVSDDQRLYLSDFIPKNMLRKNDLPDTISKSSLMNRDDTGEATTSPYVMLPKKESWYPEKRLFSQRQLQVSESINQALFSTVYREDVFHGILNKDDIQFTKVEVTRDLRIAFIYWLPSVSFLAGKKIDSDLLLDYERTLQKCAKRLRYLLTKKLYLKFSPELVFKRDLSFKLTGN